MGRRKINGHTNKSGHSDTAAGSPPARSGMRTWLARYPRAIPTLVFLAIAAITAISVYSIERDLRDRNRAEVREYAQSIATRLERRGNNFAAYLRAGAAFFSSLEEVRPEIFQQFVAELRVDQSYRGVEGIGWASAIEADDLDAFMRRARSGQPSFPDIRPSVSESRAFMAPVTYFYPDSERNRRLLGFDMYSEPVRADAMHEALGTLEPTASGRIMLAQESNDEVPGFLIFTPVFRSAMQLDNPSSEARRELAGYFFSSFDAAKLLDDAIEPGAANELGVRLYDGTPDTDHLLVSRSLGTSGTDRFSQAVRIANRDLMLVIDSAGSAHLAPLSMLTLVSGLALASLVMLILRMLARQAREDEARLVFLEEQHSIRNSLSRELNHRVKNTLANVLSIMALTRRRASNLDDFADSLEGRVRSLSATHDLLTDSDWGTTPIDAVIQAELKHVVKTDGQKLTLSGPPVELAPNDALSFGLAIHELATNAAKYGALSAPAGEVRVSWEFEGEGLAKVEWLERGGPEVAQTRERGFGLDLIEKIVAHELRNAVEIEFHPHGVRCVIRIPIRQRGEFQMRGNTAPTESQT